MHGGVDKQNLHAKTPALGGSLLAHFYILTLSSRLLNSRGFPLGCPKEVLAIVNDSTTSFRSDRVKWKAHEGRLLHGKLKTKVVSDVIEKIPSLIGYRFYVCVSMILPYISDNAEYKNLLRERTSINKKCKAINSGNSLFASNGDDYAIDFAATLPETITILKNIAKHIDEVEMSSELPRKTWLDLFDEKVEKAG